MAQIETKPVDGLQLAAERRAFFRAAAWARTPRVLAFFAQPLVELRQARAVEVGRALGSKDKRHATYLAHVAARQFGAPPRVVSRA